MFNKMGISSKDMFVCLLSRTNMVKSVIQIMDDALRAHREGYADHCVVAFPDGKETIRFFEREKAWQIAMNLHKTNIPFALLKEKV